MSWANKNGNRLENGVVKEKNKVFRIEIYNRKSGHRAFAGKTEQMF